jgi:hypothetical protein
MIKFELKNLQDAKRAMSPKVYRQALTRASRRTLPLVKKIVRDETTKEFNIGPSKIDKISKSRITQQVDSSLITMAWTGRRINLAAFSAGSKLVNLGKPTKFGKKRRMQFVRIKMKGDRKLIKGGFKQKLNVGSIASPKGNDLILKRVGAERTPIASVKTISIAEMIGTRKILGRIRSQVPPRYRNELYKALNFQLNKELGKVLRR